MKNLKKVFFAIAAIIVITNCQAQLTETYKSDVIYTWGGNLLFPRLAEIKHIDGVYILLGGSNNSYEKTMHSIVLGDSKEQAINSIIQLSTLKNSLGKKDELNVLGINGKTTKIYKVAFGTVVFSTSGVAGVSDVLYFLSETRANEIVEAIRGHQN